MLFSSNKKSLLTNEQQAQDATRFLTTVSPLVQSIYSNSALFAIGKGLNNVAEIFMYLLGLAIIAFSFIMNTIFPFHILGEIISKHVYEQALTSKGEIETFSLAIKGLVILIGLLCIAIGIQIRNSGKRKTLLQQAAKTVTEDQAKRMLQMNSQQIGQVLRGALYGNEGKIGFVAEIK